MAQSTRIADMLRVLDENIGHADGRWIEEAIKEYLQFMQFESNESVSPSVEIDIVWHTHQLSGVHYLFVLFVFAGLHPSDHPRAF